MNPLNEMGYEDPCPDCKWHCDANGFPRHKQGCPRIPPPPIGLRVTDLEKRLEAVEKLAHEPFDFTELVARLEALERRANGAELRAQGLAEEVAKLKQRLDSGPSPFPPRFGG